MAKSKTVFRCQQCGFESPKWNGKCPSCGAWNSLVEETIQPAAAKAPASRKKADLSNFIQELQAVDTQEDIRYQTGIGELDRVLGGGLVKGSIVLLGGEPGIGKSTLLLQICEFFGASHSILYVSGEESTKQIKLRAERLHVTTESLYLLANNDAQSICDTIAACEPDIVIIDSIQTMQITELSSSPGSLTQVRTFLCIPQSSMIFRFLLLDMSIKMERLQGQRSWSILWIPCYILRANGISPTVFCVQSRIVLVLPMKLAYLK